MYQDRLTSEIQNIVRKIKRNKALKISTAKLEKDLERKMAQAAAKGIIIKNG